jgi:hypothetical protein
MFIMADKLIDCTKEQQRPVIRYLWPEGVKSGEVYVRMTVQYGDNCKNQNLPVGGKVQRRVDEC